MFNLVNIVDYMFSSLHSTSGWLSPNSITPTLQQTQITNIRDTKQVSNFHDLCPRQFDKVRRLCRRLSTFHVHCNRLNSITATQTGLLRTRHKLFRKHLNMSRWYVPTTFVICVHDFPGGEVSVSQRNGIWALQDITKPLL